LVAAVGLGTPSGPAPAPGVVPGAVYGGAPTPVSGPPPVSGPSPVSAPTSPVSAPMPAPAPASMPAGTVGWGPGAGLPGMPAQPGGPGLQPVPGNGVPPVENRRGMPAAGGLTAAQVRGRTQPDPPPETGGWPPAGAVYQAG
jgi:hypothetical protein